MNKKSFTKGKETILVTGASGFIGEHLLDVLKDHYHIYALARRTQKQVGIPLHENIIWNLVDITEKDQLEKAFNRICSKCSIEYIIHLAAYYDFGDQYNKKKIYEQTNVLGTKHILELAKQYKIKHFIFASSLVASKFPAKGDLVYEQSPIDADFTYAITKQKGEKLVTEYSKYFKCSIVRFAAVYSDCCNYEPLYNFMTTWLSNSWKSRMIAGSGQMAIPYIHINCVTDILNKIINQTDKLSNLNIFLASSDNPVQLMELFTLCTRLYFGEAKKPIFVPAFLSRMWIIIRDLTGRLVNKRPFERYWMTKYIDEIFPTDCSITRQTLNWESKERHDIKRRMLYLIENLKSNPHEWHRKNLSRIKRFVDKRPSVKLYETMQNVHEDLVEKIYKKIMLPENAKNFAYCQEMSKERLKWNINVVFNNLIIAVRYGDRSIMINFGHDLAKARYAEGVTLKELCSALGIVKDIIINELYRNQQLSDIKLLVNDNIALSIQLVIDEIQDTYDILNRKKNYS
ncbi:MAG: NAD(P)-dependent oxidoreductase [Candidatus Marinimicrobia bacterium]|nr:NAD(P)-dependent oxidoreductase [Candidatus Neomarinimicrobiota bacterium]